MKSIITSDKANKPYGFAQLDANANIPGNVTASYASVANIANTSVSAAYAENGTQWIDTNNGIKYSGGSEVKLERILPGVLVTAYTTNNNQHPSDTSDFDTLISASAIITQSVYPNINHISRNEEHYALVIQGYITVPTTDMYTFGLESDDASEAFVDDVRVAYWYGGHGGNNGQPYTESPTAYSGSILLEAGKHPLLVRFEEISGGDFVTLYYKTGSMSWTVVPDEWFTYSGGNTDLIVTGSVNISGSLTVNGVSPTPSYKSYVALLNQSGTDAPVATVLENTLDGTPVWSRSSAGEYYCTLNGAFTADKTVVFITHDNWSGYVGLIGSSRISDDQVIVSFSDSSGNYFDMGSVNDSIEIRVYN